MKPLKINQDNLKIVDNLIDIEKNIDLVMVLNEESMIGNTLYVKISNSNIKGVVVEKPFTILKKK